MSHTTPIYRAEVISKKLSKVNIEINMIINLNLERFLAFDAQLRRNFAGFIYRRFIVLA